VKWKPNAVVLVTIALAVLALLFSHGMKQRQIAVLEQKLKEQQHSSSELAKHMLSQVYLNRALCGWHKIPNETYGGSREVVTASLIGDVHLADIAFSLPLPEQIKYEFIMFAYSAYEDLYHRAEIWPESFAIPDFDWSSTEALESSIIMFREKPSTRHWGKINGITGASLDVPKLEKWKTYEEFKASFDTYRFRPTGILALRKKKAQQRDASDAAARRE
jgi:hypothetical protein